MSAKNYVRMVVLLALVALGWTVPAPNQAATYEDHFTTLRPDYFTDKSVTSVKDGTLQMKFQGVNTSRIALNNSMLFNDMDATVSTAILDDGGRKATDIAPSTGFIFWATDDSNYYAVKLNADGDCFLSRLVAATRWVRPIQPVKMTKFNKGVGQYNTVRVVVKGSHVTCYINGEKLGECDGQVPPGGSQIGFESEDFVDSPMVAAFKDLVVKY